MKLATILEAYDNNLGQSLAKKYDTTAQEIKTYVRGIDQDLTFGAWILRAIKGYLESQGIKKWTDFLENTPTGDYKNAAEISNIINRLLTTYKARQEELPEKDINKYTISTLNAALKALPEPTKRDHVAEMPGTRLLFKEEPYEVYEITDPNTLVHLSTGSAWCVRYDTHAKRYLNDSSQIMIFKNGNATCLFASDLSEIKNSGNTTETRPEILEIVNKAVLKLTSPEDIYANLFSKTTFKQRDLRDLNLLTQAALAGSIDGQQYTSLLDPTNLPEHLQQYLLDLPETFSKAAYSVLAQTQDKDLLKYLAKSVRATRKPWPEMEKTMLTMPLNTTHDYWTEVRLANRDVVNLVAWPEYEKRLVANHNLAGGPITRSAEVENILSYWAQALNDWPEIRQQPIEAQRLNPAKTTTNTITWLAALARDESRNQAMGTMFDTLATEFAQNVQNDKIRVINGSMIHELEEEITSHAKERGIPFDVSKILLNQQITASWPLERIIQKDKMLRDRAGITEDKWAWFFIVTPLDLFVTDQQGSNGQASRWAQENGVTALTKNLVYQNANIDEVYEKLSELLEHMEGQLVESAYNGITVGATNGIATARIDMSFDEDDQSYNVSFGRERLVRELIAKEMQSYRHIKDYKNSETFKQIGTLTFDGEIQPDGSINSGLVEMIVPRSVFQEYKKNQDAFSQLFQRYETPF